MSGGEGRMLGRGHGRGLAPLPRLPPILHSSRLPLSLSGSTGRRKDRGEQHAHLDVSRHVTSLAAMRSFDPAKHKYGFFCVWKDLDRKARSAHAGRAKIRAARDRRRGWTTKQDKIYREKERNVPVERSQDR